MIVWDVMLCVSNILHEPATSIFREDNNQTAQLRNLETTHAVKTSDFVFLAQIVRASFFGVVFQKPLTHLELKIKVLKQIPL
jgi:hypothetical protein